MARRTFKDPQTGREEIIGGTFADASGLHSTTYMDELGWLWLIDASDKGLTGGGQYKAQISPVQVDPATKEKTANNPYGAKPGRTVAAADDFLGIAEAIDEAILRWKMEQKAKAKSEGSWLWLILLAALVLTDKKKR